MIPFAPNFNKKFFTLIRDGATFLKVKRSNKIETFQYLKKTAFYKLVLGFQGQSKTKITGKQSDLGKSLDPNAQ